MQEAEQLNSYLDGRLEITSGDITKVSVDAIVNAANSSLMGGGGVDGAIHATGGPSILSECRKIREQEYPNGLPPGEAVITTGGNLPAPYVIHTVGPVWHGGRRNEPSILYNAYYNSLVLAGKKNLSSVAFPAISTGVYGFPKELAVKTAYQAVKDYTAAFKTPRKIQFVFYSPEDKNLCTSVLEKTSTED